MATAGKYLQIWEIVKIPTEIFKTIGDLVIEITSLTVTAKRV